MPRKGFYTLQQAVEMICANDFRGDDVDITLLPPDRVDEITDEEDFDDEQTGEVIDHEVTRPVEVFYNHSENIRDSGHVQPSASSDVGPLLNCQAGKCRPKELTETVAEQPVTVECAASTTQPSACTQPKVGRPLKRRAGKCRPKELTETVAEQPVTVECAASTTQISACTQPKVGRPLKRRAGKCRPEELPETVAEQPVTVECAPSTTQPSACTQPKVGRPLKRRAGKCRPEELPETVDEKPATVECGPFTTQPSACTQPKAGRPLILSRRKNVDRRNFQKRLRKNRSLLNVLHLRHNHLHVHSLKWVAL